MIENVRAIKHLHWEIPMDSAAGWHVILGDNSSGKSSFLRAVSLGLLGVADAAPLWESWSEWVRAGATEGHVVISGDRVERTVFFHGETTPHLSETVAPGSIHDFSAAYGPFRRFRGGGQDGERAFKAGDRLSAHISVFSEGVALTEALPWLRELDYERLKARDPEGGLLARIIEFVNQDGFLPQGVRLRGLSTDRINFVDADNSVVGVEQLGDGFRSVLSMMFELMRQLSQFFAPSQIFSSNNQQITSGGVVLIDEVDAHLHPTWQKQIGFSLTKHFPNIQFIVTTHSPLVCHAAVRGSIFRLRTPGSDEESRMLTGVERDRLIYGDILDAYSTEAFGTGETRSDEAYVKLDRLGALNVKEVTRGLTDEERQEQSVLRAVFPGLMPGMGGA